uniref:Uncharacterized protein n=1 Tax=Anguilla anguilla TaxID=7936 RepID=A0A0E9UJ90_ANGAN
MSEGACELAGERESHLLLFVKHLFRTLHLSEREKECVVFTSLFCELCGSRWTLEIGDPASLSSLFSGMGYFQNVISFLPLFHFLIL